MVYTGYNEYEVIFFKDKRGRIPILEYIEKLDDKAESKILKYIEYLRINNGYLKGNYCKHITDKIWELRVDFSRNYFRIFYFIYINKKIILLHIFSKKTNKTPKKEIEKALNNYNIFLKY